jgi:hypothetical protein
MRCIGRRVETLVGHGCSEILNPYLFLCFRFRGGVAAGRTSIRGAAVIGAVRGAVPDLTEV